MKILSIILLSLFVQSCSWIGSRAIVLNKPAHQLNHVAVIIAQDEVFETNGSISEYYLFIKTIAEELAKKKIFHFTILDRKYPIDAFDDLQLSLLGIELMEHYDAYMICTPRLKGRFNHKVELRLYQSYPTRQLIYVSHNTSMGNSYMWYPNPTSTLLDATMGVVEALDHRYRKMKY